MLSDDGTVTSDDAVPGALEADEPLLATVVGAGVATVADDGAVDAADELDELDESRPHAAIDTESAQNAPNHLSLDTFKPPGLLRW